MIGPEEGRAQTSVAVRDRRRLALVLCSCSISSPKPWAAEQRLMLRYEPVSDVHRLGGFRSVSGRSGSTDRRGQLLTKKSACVHQGREGA